MSAFMVQDKKTKQVIGIYPHFALISFVNRNNIPINAENYYTVTPVSRTVRTNSKTIGIVLRPKNKNWQHRLWSHFADKYESHQYIDGDSCYTWYEGTILPKSKDYKNLPKPPVKHHLPRRYRRHQSHSIFSWRHVRSYNRLSNFRFNSLSTELHMRHKGRHLQTNFDYENWQMGRSTGWKDRKIRHQYMVHLTRKKWNNNC